MRPLTLPDGRKPFTKIHSVPTQDEAESLLLDGTGKPVDCGEFGTLAGARNFAPGQVKKWTGVERIFIPGNGVEGNFAGEPECGGGGGGGERATQPLCPNEGLTPSFLLLLGETR